MSKFGSDNGSKKTGYEQSQTALNGFRLDSSQSSWLMDRLNALNEADKIEMSAQQAKLLETNEPGAADGQHTGHYNGHSESGDQAMAVPAQVFEQQRQAEAGNHMAASAGGLETGEGYYDHDQHEQQAEPGYQMSGEDDYHGHPGAQGKELDDAALLKSKIESLEQKLADITTLTNPQAGPGQHIDEHKVVHQQPPQAHPQQMGQRPVTQDYSNQYEQVHERHPPHNEALVQDDHGYQQPYQEDANGGEYGDGAAAYGQEGYHNQVQHQPDAHFVNNEQHGGQYGAPVVHGHQQVYHQHQGQGMQPAPAGHYGQGVPQVQNELPQFLTPMQGQKKINSSYVGVVSVFAVLIIVAGVSFSYFNTGVSDVVKNSGSYDQADIARGAIDEGGESPKVMVAGRNPTFSVDNLIGEAGRELSLGITLPNDAQIGSALVILRGLPEWAKLNRGREMNNMWIVAGNEAGNLKVKVPDDEPGTFAFEVDLVMNAGAEPITRKVTAVIAAVKETKPAVQQPVQPEREVVEDQNSVIGSTDELQEDTKTMIKHEPVDSGAKRLIIDEALEEKWLERGTRLLRAGDVTAARLAFSHLAEQGSGRGALAMGMTFDPNQPSARIVAGIKPDVSRALFWYRRALLLGNEGARDPIRLLEKK